MGSPLQLYDIKIPLHDAASTKVNLEQAYAAAQSHDKRITKVQAH
jgi:hypothetical protein